MNRIIEYNRHAYNDSEKRESKLIYFIYDIPYFGGCGILPPLHIINQIFREGDSEGGMSPGATWKSFEISKEEYDNLVEDIENTDLKEITPFARYAQVIFKLDHSFDHIDIVFGPAKDGGYHLMCRKPVLTLIIPEYANSAGVHYPKTETSF